MFRAALTAGVVAMTAIPGLAADRTVQVSASFNVQSAITGTTEADVTAQEQRLKRAMYARGARECADLVATIALSCSISGINVSTQINQTYGQPPTIYVNSNVNMQVTLKCLPNRLWRHHWCDNSAAIGDQSLPAAGVFQIVVNRIFCRWQVFRQPSY